MHPVAEQIRQVAQALSAQADDSERVVSVQTELNPWALWLLLALVRQVERQRWVGSVVVSNLGADPVALSEAGSFGHPPGPQSGLVPDLPDWEYYFHGRGCCLTHRVSGESVDVDFYDGSPDWIDDYFFVRYLETQKAPEPVEQRLLALSPSVVTIALGCQELETLGVVRKHPDSKVITPLEDFLDLSDEIETVGAALESDHQRPVLARLVGDWLLLDDDTGPSDQSQKCIAARQRELESRLADEQTERLALIALCDLVPDPSGYLTHALSQEPSGTTSAALQIVAERPEEDWSDDVFGLLCRTNPNGDIPHPHTWTKCAEYLLERSRYRSQIEATFPQISRRSLGDAAILGLEHFPDLSVELFRRALRSDVPIDRITAAAALAVLDRPWCHQLLLDVLEESTDPVTTSECRAALMATPHRKLHNVVTHWEQANPHEAEPGPFLSMTEMALRERDSRIQWEMQRLHDRVIKLRGIDPAVMDVPQRRRWWWPFG